MIGKSMDLWAKTKIFVLKWDVYDIAINKLYNDLVSFPYNHIVGIARGGLVPAVSISERLNIHEVSSIGIRRNLTDDIYPKRDIVNIYLDGLSSVKGKNVLIVDDIIGDGATLRSAIRFVEERKPAVVHTLSLVVNTKAQLWPNYFWTTVDDWVIFPWENTCNTDKKIVFL